MSGSLAASVSVPCTGVKASLAATTPFRVFLYDLYGCLAHRDAVFVELDEKHMQ